MTMTQILWLASLIAGLIGAVTLYLSGRDYPNPSWDRETKPEKQHKFKQCILKWVGLVCVFAAFIFAVIAIM